MWRLHLARRPAKLSTTNDMNMHLVYTLASVRTVVHNFNRVHVCEETWKTEKEIE